MDTQLRMGGIRIGRCSSYVATTVIGQRMNLQGGYSCITHHPTPQPILKQDPTFNREAANTTSSRATLSSTFPGICRGQSLGFFDAILGLLAFSPPSAYGLGHAFHHISLCKRGLHLHYTLSEPQVGDACLLSWLTSTLLAMSLHVSRHPRSLSRL